MLTADVGGEPESTPVVLLHGGGQTRHSWGKAARELVAAGYHVLAVDLRGHGDSDWSPDGDYCLDAQIEDVYALVRTLPSPPVLVGASVGGLISLTAMGESQSPIARAAIFVDVTPKVNQEGAQRILGFMRANPEGFANTQEAAEAIAAYLPHRPRPRSLAGLRRNLRLRQDGRYYWHWDPRFLETFEVGEEERYAVAARTLRCEVLLVRGSQSELVDMESVHHFRSLIPDAEYVDVLGARHMVAGDRNDAFVDTILEFITRRA
ncbi:MAG: alpha/beta hydrolase [Candidatus Paceibacterota bacterium]